VPSRAQVVDAFRRLGPVGFARAGSRAAAERVHGPVRRARLRVRPLRVSGAEVARALAPDWRERALAALPVVADWAPEPEWAVATAEPIMRHEFDLLGSGPVQLGERVDWQLDFKSGRRWPLEHISQLPIVYPDASDIKVPWELCRCQHLPVLAAAWKRTGEQRYLDEIGAQLTSFIDDNPVEFGACWACTMDVAIRAANWVTTLALCPDQPWTGRVLQSLLLHGRFIRSHLEWGEVRGNHYLSDIAGLLPLAALFPNEGWQTWAAAQLVEEMDHQVRPDGVDHEMSTSYHRLVTELFVRSTEAADSLGQTFPDWYDERLRLMLDFIREYTRPDGLAPLVGDEDSGRYLPLGDYGADPRDHGHLIRGLPAARGSAAMLRGGFYVLRRDDLYVLIRCGDTGLYGLGGHAHNDQLSFELCLGNQPMVIDPGAYIYTAEPEARNLFRSTAFHSTMQIDGGEQNELRSDYLFTLPDRSKAERLHSDMESFEGRHHGFPGAVHTRRIVLTADGIRIDDRADGGSSCDWSFPLAPGADVAIGEGHAIARWPGGASLTIESPDLAFRADDGWYSPRYGVRERTAFVRAHRAASAEPAIFNLRSSR
jgi:Heparinase II/III-like protein/Heparinase II/III N-terminus